MEMLKNLMETITGMGVFYNPKPITYTPDVTSMQAYVLYSKINLTLRLLDN